MVLVVSRSVLVRGIAVAEMIVVEVVWVRMWVLRTMGTACLLRV
jgi:hypothetical protein